MIGNRILLLVAAGLTIAATVSLYPQSRKPAPAETMVRGAAYRILLGVGESEPASWDGSISVAPGKIAQIRGFRFSGKDTTDGASSWNASTHAAPQRKGRLGAVMAAGVIVTAA